MQSDRKAAPKCGRAAIAGISSARLTAMRRHARLRWQRSLRAARASDARATAPSFAKAHESVTLRLPQPFTKAPALDPLSCGASSYAAREASHPLAGFLSNDRLSPFPLWKLTSEP